MTSPGAFRLLLALLVVLHHSFPLRMGAFAVFVFFILSGYWIARMWESKYRRTIHPYFTFLVSRWWRLAPVFLTCLILTSLSSFVMNEVVPALAVSPAWWLRQVPVIGSGSAGRILPPSWSIDVEMQFYVAAPLLLLVAAWKKGLALCMLLAGTTVFLAWMLHSGQSAESPCGWLYLPFFLSGILLYRTRWQARRSLAFTSILLILIFTASLLAWPQTRPVLWIQGMDESTSVFATHTNTWRWLWTLGSAFLTIPFVSWNVNQPSDGFDRELGNLSYPLYLFHWIPREWYSHFAEWNSPAWKAARFLSAI